MNHYLIPPLYVDWVNNVIENYTDCMKSIQCVDDINTCQLVSAINSLFILIAENNIPSKHVQISESYTNLYFDINNCLVTLDVNTNQFSVIKDNYNTYQFTNYKDMESIVEHHHLKGKEKANGLKLLILYKKIITYLTFTSPNCSLLPVMVGVWYLESFLFNKLCF